MKEKLVKYWERQMMMMERCDSIAVRKTFFDHCFGALEFCQFCRDGLTFDEFSELCDLWTNEWREKIEGKVYK